MAPTKQARRVGIYVRISKDRANEVSTQVQETDARALAKARGYEVHEVYSDVGRSAFKPGTPRPGFERLRDDLAAGLVDGVIAYKLDRLARSVRDFAAFNDFCEQNGADIILTSQPIDTTGATGKLLRNVLAAFAEFESELKSERISASMALKARDGRPHPGGTRMFGYSSDRSRLVPAEARQIREAARKVLDGDSLASIARSWNARGVATTRDGEWAAPTLGRLLRNPFLAGLRVYGGSTIEGDWPPVLDVKTHEKLIAILSDPSRRSSDTTKVRHLLAGFVTCGCCERPLVSRPHRKHGPRYLCASGPGRGGCGKIAANVPLVDAEVTRQVLDILTASADNIAKHGAERPRLDSHALEAEAGEVAERQRELSRQWAAGKLSTVEWQTARDVLAERADEIDRDLRVARNGTVPDLPRDREGMEALWAAADLDERRALLRLVVDHVEIRSSTQRGKWDPERVVVTWA